jgi:hypothetical protein
MVRCESGGRRIERREDASVTDSQKIQWLFDRTQISEAVSRYPVSVDSRDWKLFRSIFTDEIEIFLGMATRSDRSLRKVKADDFTKVVTGVIESFSVTQHFLTEYHVEVNGDEAVSMNYMQARHFAPRERPSQPIWDVGGYYTYHLRRIGDQWKIPKYTLLLTWEINRPADLKIDL